MVAAVVTVGIAGLSTATGSATPRTQVDPNGVLKYATDLAGLGTDRALDPIKSRSITDFVQLNMIYDTLLHAQDDGSYKPGLAQSYKVEGDNVVTVTLRPNLKFSDGTPVDANAEKFSIDRAIAANNNNFAPQLKEVQSVDVIDPSTVKYTLKSPTVGSFLELLAGRETMPVSPTAVQANPDGFNTHPVGAGPMTLSDFKSQQILSLRKSRTYWDAKNWKLGGIDMVQAAAGAPRINAYRGGQANMVELDASQAGDLQGVPGAVVKSVASNSNYLYLATCKSKPPFDNVKFRQGVQTAMNRDVLNNVLLNGAGEPQYTLWPKSSQYFTKSLDNAFAYNKKKAKQLITQSGWDFNQTLQIGFVPASAQLKTFGEAFQQQMADVGVKVELVPMADIVTQFYKNVETPAAVSQFIRPGVQKITLAFGPNTQANVCQYNDPTLLNWATQIAAEPPGSPKLKKLWDQVNDYVTNNVLWDFGVWQPIVTAYNAKQVGGVKSISPSNQGPDFSTIYIKK